MTIATIVPTSTPDPDIAAQFARDIAPHLDVLARGARRRTLCRADADDLVQDTLVRAFTGFHTFQPGSVAGGTSIARFVLPQADGNAQAR